MPDDVERLALEVTVDDKATKPLDKLADTVDELEHADPVVDVKVDTTTGDRELDAMFDKAKNPPKVVFEVDDDALARTGRKVSDDVGHAGGIAGKNFGEQFARDVGSTFAADNPALGIGADLAAGIETGFGALGAESLAGPIIAALGIGTVAVTAAKAIWDVLNKGAGDYKKAVEDAKSVQEQLFAGQDLQAIKTFDQKFGGIVTRAQELGKLSPQDVFAFLTGAPNKPVEDFIANVQQLNGETVAAGGTLTDTNFALGHLVENLIDAKKASGDATKQLEQQGDRQLDYLKAIKASNATLLTYASTAAPAARQATIDYVVELNKIPPSKATELKADVDRGDLAAAQKLLDDVAADRTVTIKMQAEVDQFIRDFIKAGGNFRSALGGILGQQSVGTTIVNLPPTLNPNAVVAATAGARTRSGGLSRARPAAG